MRKKVLVVDDEPSISLLIEFNLKLAGFDVKCVYDGREVFQVIPHFRPDLIILDLMLPKMDGLSVCKKLREERNHVPIIMLTALQDLSDKIAGLDVGADDYMTKPFSTQELVSRIQAILRRSNMLPADGPGPMIDIGPLRIDYNQRKVTIDEQLIELTPKEFELLHFLALHQGKVLSREQLLQGVWDYHFMGDTRIVDVHVSHLRDKIERNPRAPQFITTIRNVGYKMNRPHANSRVSGE